MLKLSRLSLFLSLFLCLKLLCQNVTISARELWPQPLRQESCPILQSSMHARHIAQMVQMKLNWCWIQSENQSQWCDWSSLAVTQIKNKAGNKCSSNPLSSNNVLIEPCNTFLSRGINASLAHTLGRCWIWATRIHCSERQWGWVQGCALNRRLFVLFYDLRFDSN